MGHGVSPRRAMKPPGHAAGFAVSLVTGFCGPQFPMTKIRMRLANRRRIRSLLTATANVRTCRHCGLGSSSASSFARHSPSMIPSIRSGRKRRWKAITAFCGSVTS